MARVSATLALRHFQTLYTRGVVGNLADSQLLHRFVDGGGLDREDAFAALVDRHGPMVRRSAAGCSPPRPTRKTHSRPSSSCWRGRPARCVRPSRSALAPRRDRPHGTGGRRRGPAAVAGGAGDGGTAALLRAPRRGGRRDPPGAGRGDRPPALRYREPILACELEGTSRQDAVLGSGSPRGRFPAGWPGAGGCCGIGRRDAASRRGGGGTRCGDLGRRGGHDLARSPRRFRRSPGAPVRVGRGRDRDHPGGGDLAGSGSARDPEGEHVEAPGRRDGLDRRGGCLSAGLAWAAGVGRLAVSNEAGTSRPLPAGADDRPSANRATIRGRVVDEHDRPVPGAEVLAWAFTPLEAGTTAGPDGHFARRINRPTVRGASLLARSADGDRLGILRLDYDCPVGAAESPVRITLKPARRIAVRVFHAKQGLVPDVPVEAASTAEIYARAATSLEGLATLRIPADARVEWIYAVKPGLGCDYAEFGSRDPKPEPRRGRRRAPRPCRPDARSRADGPHQGAGRRGPADRRHGVRALAAQEGRPVQRGQRLQPVECLRPPAPTAWPRSTGCR